MPITSHFKSRVHHFGTIKEGLQLLPLRSEACFSSPEFNTKEGIKPEFFSKGCSRIVCKNGASVNEFRLIVVCCMVS